MDTRNRRKRVGGSGFRSVTPFRKLSGLSKDKIDLVTSPLLHYFEGESPCRGRSNVESDVGMTRMTKGLHQDSEGKNGNELGHSSQEWWSWGSFSLGKAGRSRVKVEKNDVKTSHDP